jgi:hypothetical protein
MKSWDTARLPRLRRGVKQDGGGGGSCCCVGCSVYAVFRNSCCASVNFVKINTVTYILSGINILLLVICIFHVLFGRFQYRRSSRNAIE